MPSITWDRLLLSGFGCYRSTVEIALHPSLSVLVGPNETGKSTLIAGLTAVLFGLPASQDATVFGQSRWRNWHHPDRFSGELFFRVDGEQWHLTRDFASNRISLRQRLGDSWREVVQGTDNPSARRPLQRYHEQLRRLLGVARRELFQVTFCLTQPLPPPEELDQAIQSMLAGADSRVSQVQGALEGQIKAITRHYGEALGSGRDGNRDRQLEELQLEMNQLEQAIAAGRSVADGLQAVQAELGRVMHARGEMAESLLAAEELSHAWSAWRTHHERYQRLLTEQQQLELALERALQLQATLNECRQMLQQYADMADADQDWPQRLERLAELQSEQQVVDSRLQSVEEDLQAIRDELAAQADTRVRSTVSGQSQVSFADARLTAQEEAVDSLQRRLQTEFALLENATPEQVAQLAVYHRRRLELGGRHREAERLCLMLGEREQAFRSAEDAWQQRYGPLRQDAERLLAAVNRRMQQIGGRRARQQTPTAMSSLLPWLVALLTAGVAYGLWGRQAGPLGTGGSLLCAAAAWVIMKLLGRERTLPGGKADTDMPELGQFAALDWADLLTARTLLERLSLAQSERPAGELVVAEATREAAADELAAWERAMAPFTAAFPDPEAAYRRWQDLRQELRAAKGDLTAMMEGIRLGAERETESRRAQRELRLQRTEEQRQQLLRSRDSLRQLWEEELQAIPASWQVATGLEALKQRYRAFAEWRQQSDEATKRLGEILTVFQVDSLEALQRQRLDLQNGIVALQMRWQELIDQHPGLPGLREAERSDRVQTLFQAGEVRLQELRRADRLQAEQVESLLRQQATLEGQSPCNLALAAERLQQLTTERNRLRLEVAALGLAYRELALAKTEYEGEYRDQLARQATFYFDRISGERGRLVELSPDFQVTLLSPAGKTVLPAQLSQGARDQLYFSLRLAIADLLADQCQLPFILDDPFVNSDALRLQRIRAALEQTAADRQILLFTHQEAFLDWGEVVPLPSGE